MVATESLNFNFACQVNRFISLYAFYRQTPSIFVVLWQELLWISRFGITGKI